MHTWIGHDRAEAPAAVLAATEALGDLKDVPGLRTTQGGIQRETVLSRIGDRLEYANLVRTTDSHLDAWQPRHGVGLRVDAGRAHSNNDGVIATLAAAAEPSVRSLVLLVPNVYKGSVCADRVIERLGWILASPGIDLDLDGVALMAY